jgi:hypothetical protein
MISLKRTSRIEGTMAEHINQATEPKMDPFDAMGKPISSAARQVGYDACRAMGLDAPRSWECVGAVSDKLERDKPYDAQGAAMKFLDLTGSYRLMATILAAAQAQA